jgi:hypothetical protein
MDAVTGIPLVGQRKISDVQILNELETLLASNYFELFNLVGPLTIAQL